VARARLAAIAAALATGACQSASQPPPDDLVAYYQLAGSKQCERGGKTPEALKQELSAAGVQVTSVACGHDGRVYAQSCGGPDGRILTVKVPQAQAAAASRLGLKPLRELPDATAAACR
jgi:hypothetical protein